MTENYSPFLLTTAPRGWVVSWPDYTSVVAKNERQVFNLLKILFDDIGVWQAKLGVKLVGGDLETYCIDSSLWYEKNSREYLPHHIASRYVVEGVCFNHNEEQHARKFLEHLEKRYIWLKLSGAHWS